MEPIDLELLAGTQSRTYKTRQITDEMVARPVHVAIALWDVPWESAPSGQIEGWVIAVDSPRARFVRGGQTKRGGVVEGAIRELRSALRQVRGQVWIVTGRRQIGLRLELERQSFLVTGSFAEQNRAGSRASMARKKAQRAAERKGKTIGEVPEKVAAERPRGQAHWWPRMSRTQAPPADRTVRIATDASTDGIFRGSMCFVADNGDYQLRTADTPASSDELELETITLALKYLRQVNATRAIVESDSVAALEAAEHLLSGHHGRGRSRMNRPWRGISPGARSRFQQAWRDLEGTCAVDLRRVLGHAGDPLNQAADKIAYMGMRAVAHRRAESQSTLETGIRESLHKAVREA